MQPMNFYRTMRQVTYRKFLLLGFAISSVCPSLGMGMGKDTTCVPKEIFLQGQSVSLDENCMLSFPGYGNNNYGRSYIDHIGELFVFAQVAETGVDSKDYGSRSYYLLPVRRTSDFEVNESTGELVIRHSSGETMILGRDFKVKSFTGVDFVEAEKSSDANKGGFEIKSYKNGILLDTGWTHSSITIKPQGQSVFTDRDGKTCTVKNKEIFDFVGTSGEDTIFKYPGREELQGYLKSHCPKLDLAPL